MAEYELSFRPTRKRLLRNGNIEGCKFLEASHMPSRASDDTERVDRLVLITKKRPWHLTTIVFEPFFGVEDEVVVQT